MLQTTFNYDTFEKIAVEPVLPPKKSLKRQFEEPAFQLEVVVSSEQRVSDEYFAAILLEQAERKKQRSILHKSFETLQDYNIFMCNRNDIESIQTRGSSTTLTYMFEQLNLLQTKSATDLIKFFMSLTATTEELEACGLLNFTETKTRKTFCRCICCVEEKPYSKGLCQKHYQQYSYLRRKVKMDLLPS
jgi:hypothetical protein